MPITQLSPDPANSALPTPPGTSEIITHITYQFHLIHRVRLLKNIAVSNCRNTKSQYMTDYGKHDLSHPCFAADDYFFVELSHQKLCPPTERRTTDSTAS